MSGAMLKTSWEVGLAPVGATAFADLEAWTWFPVGAVTVAVGERPGRPGEAQMCTLTRVPSGPHEAALGAWLKACREDRADKRRLLAGRCWRGAAGAGREEALVAWREATVVRARRGLAPCLFVELDILGVVPEEQSDAPA